MQQFVPLLCACSRRNGAKVQNCRIMRVRYYFTLRLNHSYIDRNCYTLYIFTRLKLSLRFVKDIRDRFEERLDESFFIALFSLLRKRDTYAKIACSIDITGRQFSFRPHNFIDPVVLCNNFTYKPVLCINLRKISSKKRSIASF